MTESRRLIWRYYAFRATNSAGFYVPIAILYLQDEGFGMEFILFAYAVFGFATLAAEIPSGYLGDWLGRRASLAIGSGLRALVLCAYPFVEAPLAYLGLHVVWATGRAFRSGTQDAWLYELLGAHFDQSQFARIEGRGSTILLATSAAGAIGGGVLYGVNAAYPFVVNAALATLGIPLLGTFPRVGHGSTDESSLADARENTAEPASSEPSLANAREDAIGQTTDEPSLANAREDAAEQSSTSPPSNPPREDDAFTVREAVRMLRLQASRPAIRWLVAYAALFNALFLVTRIYEQPALDAVGVSAGGLGVLYAGFKLVSAGAASTAGWFEDHLGTRGVFALLMPIYGLAYASIAAYPMLVVPALFLNRGVRVVTRPIRNQYLNDRLDDVGRATVLSGASMVLAFVGAVARLVASGVAEATGPVQFLPWAGVVVAVAGGALWLLVSPVRSGVESASAGATVPTD